LRDSDRRRVCDRAGQFFAGAAFAQRREHRVGDCLRIVAEDDIYQRGTLADRARTG